ncbi:hypothetical protein V5O48_017204 [Marasmius crinis-equi]|uniref:Uncharacterized protein n=1 Tax=Marasmius crinis-equi TaxID=585013 RepID=A0ABR3EPM3_9AGAR
MDATALATALPAMIESLHGSELLWVSAAYSLASTAFLPMSGGVAELYKVSEEALFKQQPQSL